MSDHVGETSEEGRKTTPEGTEGEHPGAGGGASRDDGATGVYGTAGWHPVDAGSSDEPNRKEQDPGSGGPATAVYGTTGAAVPQWSTPGDSSPQPTAVQPLPGQPGPAQPVPVQPNTATWAPTGPQPTQAYQQQVYPQGQPPTAASGAPQPTPTQQVPAGYAQAGYAPVGPAPTVGHRWNLWAGVPLAASVVALGYLWRLIKVGTVALDFPARQQIDFVLITVSIVLAVLTLGALASRKRALAAPLAFVLGGVMASNVVYSWYLQTNFEFDRFDTRFLFEAVIPVTFPALLLALVTMVSAFFMRVDDVRR